MTTATPPVARTINDFTPDWLTATLRDAGCIGTARVVGVDAQPIGTGQMSRVLRLTPTYDTPGPHAPASLIAKLASEDASARAAGNAMGFYEAEVRFYREIAPRVDAATPGCIAASINLQDGVFTLLLEDRPQLRVGDMVSGGTVDEAAAALTELAKLQAPVWNDPQLATAA